MSSRYKPHGDVKYRAGIRSVGDYVVQIEVRDVIEVNGSIWTDGCHKVVVTGPPPKPRAKTFIGEMAWADAERYAEDLYWQLRKGAA